MPSAKATSISAQQQPRQKTPCQAPVTNARPTPAAVVAEEERAGVAALPQAGLLERRELEEPGDDQRPAGDHRRVGEEPRRGVDRRVDDGVEQEGRPAEPRPDQDVGRDERRSAPLAPAAVPPRPGRRAGSAAAPRAASSPRPSPARRQEEDQGDRPRQAAVDQLVVVDEAAAPGQLGRHGKQPRAPTTHRSSKRTVGRGRAGGPGAPTLPRATAVIPRIPSGSRPGSRCDG